MLGRYTTGPDVARAEHSRWTSGCPEYALSCDDAAMEVILVPPPPLVFVILGAMMIVVVVGVWLLRRD